MNNNDKNNVVSFKKKRKQYKKKKSALKKGQSPDWTVYLQVIVFLAFLAFAMQQC